MRVDYFHTGGPGRGNRLRSIASSTTAPWAGSRTQLVDATNLGKYLFEVRDKASGRCSTRAGSRRSTASGRRPAKQKTAQRTFHESLRLPWPRQPVSDRAQEAPADNSFATSGPLDVDPASRFVNRAPLARHAGHGLARLRERPAGREGRPARSSARATRRARCRSSTPTCSACSARSSPQEPFKSRRARLQRARARSAVGESGINRPNAGVFRRTPISAEYNVFDSERYVLTFDNRALRDAASAAPYEFIEILVNDKTYGGGGIFNDQATASVDSAFSPTTSSCTSSAITSPRWPTSTTPRTSPTRPGGRRSARAVGAERHRAARSRDAEVARPRHARHAAARRRGTRRRSSSTRPRDAGAAAGDPRAERARGGDGRALPRADATGTTKFLARMKYSGKVGAFEGAAYEANGSLPAGSRLHHVHARPRRILPRLPARHQRDHRSVFEVAAYRRDVSLSLRSGRILHERGNRSRARSRTMQAAAATTVIHALGFERDRARCRRKIAAGKAAGVRVVVDAAGMNSPNTNSDDRVLLAPARPSCCCRRGGRSRPARRAGRRSAPRRRVSARARRKAPARRAYRARRSC